MDYFSVGNRRTQIMTICLLPRLEYDCMDCTIVITFVFIEFCVASSAFTVFVIFFLLRHKYAWRRM